MVEPGSVGRDARHVGRSVVRRAAGRGATVPWEDDAAYHLIELFPYASLALGSLSVYLRREGRLGPIGKVGLLLRFAAFALTAAGSLAIVVAEGLLGSHDIE